MFDMETIKAAVSYLNPWSEDHWATDGLMRLEAAERITIVVLSILVGLVTFVIGGVALFRKLVYWRVSLIPPRVDPSPVLEAPKATHIPAPNPVVTESEKSKTEAATRDPVSAVSAETAPPVPVVPQMQQRAAKLDLVVRAIEILQAPNLEQELFVGNSSAFLNIKDGKDRDKNSDTNPILPFAEYQRDAIAYLERLQTQLSEGKDAPLPLYYYGVRSMGDEHFAFFERIIQEKELKAYDSRDCNPGAGYISTVDECPDYGHSVTIALSEAIETRAARYEHINGNLYEIPRIWITIQGTISIADPRKNVACLISKEKNLEGIRARCAGTCLEGVEVVERKVARLLSYAFQQLERGAPQTWQFKKTGEYRPEKAVPRFALNWPKQ